MLPHLTYIVQMGKNKRARLAGQSSQSSHKKLKQASKSHGAASKAPHGQSPVSKSHANDNAKPKPHVQLQHTEPIIPFKPEERILLVGEGDLSFAACLVREFRCRNVTATVLEKREVELREKYEGVGSNLAILQGHEKGEGIGEGEGGKEGEGNEPAVGDAEDEEHGESEAGKRKGSSKVLYGVDATKMMWPGKRKVERWDRYVSTSVQHQPSPLESGASE